MRWSERTDLPEFMVYSAPGHRFVRFVLIVRYKCPTKMAEAQEQGTKRWEEASGGFDASPASPVLWRGEGGPPEPHWSPTTDLTPTQRAEGGGRPEPTPILFADSARVALSPPTTRSDDTAQESGFGNTSP